MKPFRITVILMALLVLPLFATQALAATFSVGVYDVPKTLVGANTVHKPVLGFIITGQSGRKLDKIIFKSYIDRYYATKKIELYKEDGTNPGFQYGEDQLKKFVITSGGEFDILDTLVMTGINVTLDAGDTFYVTLDINTSVVQADPQFYDGTCLEVVMEPGRIRLDNGDNNSNHVHNTGWLSASESPYFDPYKLCFDCLGPDFDLHFCIAANTCSLEAYYPMEPYIRVPMVDQEDSIRICATNIDGDIDTTEGIHVIGKVHLLGYVSSKHMFGVDDILLKWNDNAGDDGGADSCQEEYCDDDYSVLFQIPDERNVGGFHGVDADTGLWAVCAWAEDSLGNRDTVCLEHENLVYRIDTKKPIIDSVSWQFNGPNGDLNGDGKIGLGDCIMIIGWGYSNPIEPLKECVKMRVDTSWMAGTLPSYPNLEWAELSDTLQENNRIFRRVFCLTNPVAIDSNGGCPVNFLVEAWDNACNYDTLRDSICADMDLVPPSVSVTYTWEVDEDTMWACMSLGDKVYIRGDVGGTDIVSVTAMMDSMGIDKLMRHALLLPHRGGGLYIDGGQYDTIWTITEPPIVYGKDRDNTQPPARDSIYRAWITACDDAGNCVTDSGDLNKTLDTRRPRPVGYFCPDSVPCAIVATPLAGGEIKLEWDTACDENDAFYYYVWASFNGAPFESIGNTNVTEQAIGKYYRWHSEPLETGWWTFKIKTEDNCTNVGDFSCEVGTLADSTPPNACIVFPDSGGVYGDSFAVKARSEDPDIQSVILWYRLRSDLNDPPTGEAGQWTPCLSFLGMSRPGDGLVFLDTIECLMGLSYIGWVELLPLSCDVIGNCQDTTRAYAEACIDDTLQNLIPGHFLFYWDTTRATVRVVSVNDTISPQTLCGYNVNPDIMNQVIINVDGATPADSFTIDARAIENNRCHRIDYRNNVTMPCTIMVSVDNWDAGTQQLYVKVTSQKNGKECKPYPMIIDLCVPWQTTPCVTIVAPVEWQRIPCSKTDKTCVPIWAEITPGCPESLLTQVKFFYSKNAPGPPWNLIEEVLEPDTVEVLGHPKLYWKTCWNNLGLVQDGDTVYFMAEGFNQFHVSGTSKMVKVFVDCNAPQVKLRIEDVITTCFGTPKVAGEIILKALVVDTLVDITELNFWYKLHSDPDIPTYWEKLCDSERGWYWGWWWDHSEEFEPWSENVWACEYETEDLPNQTWIDIRVSVEDQAGNVWLDSDEDGKFDDSTFNAAVAAGAGITVFVDNVAPQPAISMVADTAASIYNVNPSTLLGGSGEAYVKAGDDINAQISVLPSEDTCEVMKVEWFLCFPEGQDDVSFEAPKASPAQGFKTIPHVEHQGDDCQNPIELTLPRDLPFSDTNHTCGRGNDYQGTCLAPFDSSDDIIYKLDVTTNVVLKIKWRTFEMWKSGVALFEGCPGHGGPALSGPDLGGGHGGRCLYDSHGIRPDHWHYLENDKDCRYLHLEPGTYYLMLDSKNWCRQGVDLASGQSQQPGKDDGNFELEITGEATGCYHVGTSNDPYHFPVNFNPVKDGLIPAYELEDDWWYGHLQAVLYDSLGNSKTDDVGLYILDVTASQAVIVDPLNDSYVSGDVTLISASLNAYEICKVCYEYKPEGDSVWHPVNDGYPNACTTDRQGFMITWHTLNTIPDGAYYLRAVATDCSNNVDTLPPTIKVTVSNGVPIVTMDDPRICSRTCPDDTVDTLGYVSGTVPLYATVSSSIPVDHVVFKFKDIFEYPEYWYTIGTDYFPTDGKYSVEWDTDTLSDGRYHVKAVAYTASDKYGESEWIVISLDNSGPHTEIISIMGEDHLANGVDISKGTVVPIEIVAIDSTSDDGWTRCYNSGLTSIEVCIASCPDSCDTFWVSGKGSQIDSIVCYSREITKCFEVDPVYDGTHTVQWNTSGLEYEGCEGCYYIYVKAYDCLGNETISDSVKVYVSDITAPVTTIGGFDGNTILGYSSEEVKTLLFEYAISGSTNWIPIGWSSFIDECDGYFLYMTTWNPASLANGNYQIRVISHDTCSNQNDSLAPVAYFTVEGGTITPYNPDVLGALSFEKNWCVGGMQGIVRETSSQGTPVVLAYYGGDYGECVDMQAHLQYTNEYAGSFFASAIEYGGPAKFFSSVTVRTGEEQMTGEPAYVTYLATGSFDVVKVKRDLGTHGTYQQGCVDVTIPGGAVGNTFTEYRYIWVAPTTMPWVPVTQPELKPIGDNNGYATYVSFTDCYYCCGWFKSNFGGEQGDISPSPSDNYGDCCFNPGRYAKIKMCYDSTVTTSKEHLAVMWWDCQTGKFCFDSIYYPPGVEGFNTTNHTVEFATTCLSGPFAVVELLEPSCNGSIVVNMRVEDIEPYSNGYTNTIPTFTSFINDRVQGTQAIDQSSIQFKVDLFNSGELIRIYTGKPSTMCDKWMAGFGSFSGSGYDPVPGIFKAGWNDPTYYNYYDWGTNCQGCNNYYCKPKYPLAAGDHMATVTAQNYNIQSCTDTVNFMVDATPPTVVFEEKCLGKDPEFTVWVIDRESGVNKDSVWLYISSPGGSYTDNLSPDQLAPMWLDDSTLHVKLPINKMSSSTNLVVFVYEGTGDGNLDPSLQHGPVDMVGNKATSFWHQYRIDVKDPTIALRKPSYRFRRPVLFDVYDDADGCGIYRIMVDECSNSPTGYTCTPAPADSVVYDRQTEILRYYPPTSGTWIQVTVKDSAHNTTFLDSTYCVEDYDPPMVTFVPSYYNGTTLCKDDPTIKFVVTDGVAGVNWNTVNVDIDACGQLITYPFTEVINHMQNDTVTLTPPIKNCSDGAAVNVYVYSDSRNSKGPADNGDTYLKNAAKWTYYADASGPTITLKTPSDSLFNRPILFEIKDTKSGLANISVFQDSVAASIIAPYAHNPGWYALSPSAGQHKINIVATDSCGNSTNYFIFTRDDWTPPVVSFVPSYVSCKTPTVKVVVTDAGMGVDWSKLKVDLYYSSLLLQTFEPSGPNAWVRNGDTITVVGNGAQFSLYDGYDLYAVVYSEKSSATSYTKGPVDLAGNWTDTKWITKDYKADCYGPSVTFRGTGLCDDSLKYEITDAKSGLAHVYVYEDSSKKDLFKQDTHNPIYWYYKPSKGRHHVDIEAIDMVNNSTLYSFDVTGDCTPPLASFGADFVACYNPTVEITLTDDVSGVDWTKVIVDMWRYSDRIQTFTPDMLVREGNTITVTGDGAWLGLTDGSTMNVYVYSAKTPATSYTKGPLDSAGNYQTSTSWFSKSYTADCSGPSVTWVWPSPTAIDSCSATLTFKIIDTYSGVDGIVITEDGVVVPHTAYSYDPLTWILTYTPSAGRHKVVITATDKLGNVSTYTFFRKDDCSAPGAKFVEGYVAKNPTVKVVVKDDKAGVDWNTVNVDLYQTTYAPYERCTFTAGDIANFNMKHGDTVIVSCTMNLADGRALTAYVYSEKYSMGSYGKGPGDVSGNFMPKWQECTYTVDAAAPVLSIASKYRTDQNITYTTEPPVKIKITETGSGIDWTTLSVTQDSMEFPAESLTINQTDGLVEFFPAPMRHQIVMSVKDKVGNLSSPLIFWTEAGELYFTSEQGAHTYPNPFDPRKTTTCIALGLSKSAYITAKLYDFAGEFVRTLRADALVGPTACIYWDGKTEDGTEVANGTYLCHIKARDQETSKIVTAVIKITVLKEDK